MTRTWRHYVLGAMLAASLVAANAALATSPKYSPDWTDAQRDWMYGFSQGSQIMPYDWFIALERPTGDERFAADGLARFGYLPRARTPANPDGLPVGFAMDTDRKGNWIGMNCTACHTGQIQFGDQLLQIDGAPAGADFYAFIAELSGSMQATLADADKFKRFAQRVARTNPDQSAAELRAALKKRSEAFAGFIVDSTPETPWGPARTDAFGMIFNRVTAIDLENPKNSTKPNGPVSYPFLWTTNEQRWIQWNGSVPNEKPIERLGRNVGQVLGVFGQMPHLASRLPVDLRRFSNSVRGRELLLADELIGKLAAPRWPGAIDAALAERGKTIYAGNCERGCHRNAAPGSTAIIEVGLTPVAEVGTDRTVAQQIAERTSVTGPLEGALVRLNPPQRLADPDKTPSILAAVVTGTILHPTTWTNGLLSLRGLDPSMSAAVARVAAGNVYRDIKATIERDGGVKYVSGRTAADGLVYKAGPLNGIWATAPYLHNGSVATMAELIGLEPRRAKFYVGNKVYDAQRMGFVSDAAPGLFEFDTGAVGNSNKGHTYTEGLSTDERRALLEYLKTL